MANINVTTVQTVQPKSKLPKIAYSAKLADPMAKHPSMNGWSAANAAISANLSKGINARASGRRTVQDPTGRYLYYMKPFIQNGAGVSARQCEGNVHKIDLSEANSNDAGEVWSKINTNKFPRDLDADLKTAATTTWSDKPWCKAVMAGTKYYVFYKKFGAATTVTNWMLYEYDPSNDTWTQKTFPYNATQWNNFTNTGAISFMRLYLTESGGKIYCITSFLYQHLVANPSASDWFREYNPATDTWTSKTTPASGTETVSHMTDIVANGTDVYWARTLTGQTKLVKYNIVGNSWADVDATFNQNALRSVASVDYPMSVAIINMEGVDRIVFLAQGSTCFLYFYNLSDGAEYNISGANNYIKVSSENTASFGELINVGGEIYLIPYRYYPLYAYDVNWQLEAFTNSSIMGPATFKANTVVDHAAIYKLVISGADVQFKPIADRMTFNPMECYCTDGTDLVGFTFHTPRNSSIDRFDTEEGTWDEDHIVLPKPFMYPNMDIDQNGDIYFFENFGHFLYKYDVSESKMYQLNNGYVRKKVDSAISGGALSDNYVHLMSQYIADFCVVPEKGPYVIYRIDAPGTTTKYCRFDKWDLAMEHTNIYNYVSLTFMGDTGRPTPDENASITGGAHGVHNMVAYGGNVYRIIGSNGVVCYRFLVDNEVVETFFPDGTKFFQNLGSGGAKLTTAICVSVYNDVILVAGYCSSPATYLVAGYSFSRDDLRMIMSESNEIIRGVGIGVSREQSWNISDNNGYGLPYLKVGMQKILDLSARGRILSFVGVDDNFGCLKIRLDGKEDVTYKMESAPQWTDLLVKFNNRIEVWADNQPIKNVGICYLER